MALLQGLVEGVSSAMSPAVAQENVRKRADRRATAQEEVQAQAQSILTNVKGVQDKIAALGPNPDPNQLGQYQAQLHTLRQDWTDLFHPIKNPGNLGVMGKILQSFRGEQGPTALTAERMARGDVAGAPVPVQVQTKNPEADYIKNLEGAGFSHEDAVEAERRKVKLDAPPPKASSESYDRIPGTLNGNIVTLWRDKHDPGHWVDQQGNDVPNDVLAQFTALPPRGALGSTTTTIDPFGVPSTSTRKPILPGPHPVGEPQGQGAKPAQPTPKQPGVQKKELEGIASRSKLATSAVKKVDANGQIPASSPGNTGLKQAANSILGGMDVDKLPIPQRDRAAAMALAQEYGWKGQGFLLPADQLRLQEAETFLTKMANSDSLKVLDEGWWKQLPMIAQAPDPTKADVGMWQRMATKLSARAETSEQADFMRQYRSLVGTITGISTLVRSGRPTEAQTNKLVAELPNPYNTQDSADAKARLQRVQQEIDIARDKGIFRNPDEMFTGEQFGGGQKGPIVVTPEDMK